MSSTLCLVPSLFSFSVFFPLKSKRHETQIKVAFFGGDYLGRERGQIYRLLGGLGIICEF